MTGVERRCSVDESAMRAALASSSCLLVMMRDRLLRRSAPVLSPPEMAREYQV